MLHMISHYTLKSDVIASGKCCVCNYLCDVEICSRVTLACIYPFQIRSQKGRESYSLHINAFFWVVTRQLVPSKAV